MVSTRLGIFLILLVSIPVFVFLTKFQKKVEAEIAKSAEIDLVRINRGASAQNVTTGVGGRVLLGPICPVVRTEETRDCQDKPLKTVLIFRNPETMAEVARTETNMRGEFLLSLVPGKYELSGPDGQSYPLIKRETIVVWSGKITVVKIEADSGIR